MCCIYYKYMNKQQFYCGDPVINDLKFHFTQSVELAACCAGFCSNTRPSKKKKKAYLWNEPTDGPAGNEHITSRLM